MARTGQMARTDRSTFARRPTALMAFVAAAVFGAAAFASTSRPIGTVSSARLPKPIGPRGTTILLQAFLKTQETAPRPLAGKTMAFYLAPTGAKQSALGAATTDASGVASLYFAIPPKAQTGSYTVYVRFAGETDKYTASSGEATLTVADHLSRL